MATDTEDLFVDIEGLKLCYRLKGNPSHPPVLLIMGLNSQLINWPLPLVDKLVAGGYWVIRFDNRDSGLTEWAQETPGSYFLADMANDAVQLLKHLEIGSAHIVGASMGGMIAQRLAIDDQENNSGRVRTLCSIMSTTGNLLVGGAAPGVIAELIKPTPADPEQAIAHIAALYKLIGSKTHDDEAGRLALAKAAYERSLDANGNPRHPGAGARQIAAIIAGGDRTNKLKTLTVPTLVIHGNEDSLINISGGRATRDAIPGAKWLGDATNGVEGMGHDLPAPLLDGIAAGILDHLNQN